MMIYDGMPKRDEARIRLRQLQEDVEGQLLFLEGNAAYAWDTSDFDNWEAMHDNIMRLAKLMKLDLL